MKRRKDEDALVTVVVAAAAAVLALTLWAGGKRLYARWQLGRGGESVAVPVPKPVDDGYDRPPSAIPPLAMVGIAPSSKTPKARPKTPAARPMPPITPDRE